MKTFDELIKGKAFESKYTKNNDQSQQFKNQNNKVAKQQRKIINKAGKKGIK